MLGGVRTDLNEYNLLTTILIFVTFRFLVSRGESVGELTSTSAAACCRSGRCCVLGGASISTVSRFAVALPERLSREGHATSFRSSSKSS